MSEAVKVPVSRDNAILLLDAAEKLGHEARVVKTTTDGNFLVPEDVAKEAGLSGEDKPKAAKKTTARKRAAKKTTSAKSADKE